MVKDVKVKVKLTDGYEKRFTECCLEILKNRKIAKMQENMYLGEKEQKNADSSIFTERKAI